MLFNEERGSISQKRHHTYKHLRQTPSRSSIRSPSETFALNCPHVTDANNEQVRIEVTWTKDDTIWLKIENGERKIYNKLSSFEKKRVGKKSVLHVTLNKGRYIFAYDELTGDFGMEIRPVIADQDEGIWQCHVTVHQKGDTYTLTSRSRVKNVQKYQQSKDGSRSQLNPLLYQEDSIAPKKEPISSFTRHEHNTIEISR
uniref:Ig-like domain-containing protein n=1 Tax=Ascaris lumbricoides TaxID=6252 RepID=A0A0M3IFZ8_ASCLU